MSTPTTPATASTWCGWHRPLPGGHWQQLCQGESYGACWGMLLARLPREGRGGESIVLEQGRSPDGAPGEAKRRSRR